MSSWLGTAEVDAIGSMALRFPSDDLLIWSEDVPGIMPLASSLTTELLFRLGVLVLSDGLSTISETDCFSKYIANDLI